MKEDMRKWRESWEFNKNGWRLFRKHVNFRYWSLWLINMIVAMNLSSWVSIAEENLLLRLATVILYFVISPLTLLLWVPQYIKLKKASSYHGIVRTMGEWVGMPYNFKDK